MNTIPFAARANVAVIEQGLRLLDQLGDERYTVRVPLCFNSAIAGHMRHVIEHYLSFFTGLECGEVNYEDRPRDPALESEVVCASSVLQSILQRLIHLAESGATSATVVHAETAPAAAAVPSSVTRELEFLLSHTIHHYALIAVMARMLGVVPEPTFGVAPSTLKFERTRGAREEVVCAR